MLKISNFPFFSFPLNLSNLTPNNVEICKEIDRKSEELSVDVNKGEEKV